MNRTPLTPERRVHTNPFNLWATSFRAPLTMGELDAPIPTRKDEPWGKHGWDVGIDFDDLAHLAQQLSDPDFELPPHVCGNDFFNCGRIERFQIVRMAIEVHGAPGAMDVDGLFHAAADADATDELPAESPHLLNVAS